MKRHQDIIYFKTKIHILQLVVFEIKAFEVFHGGSGSLQSKVRSMDS